MSFGIASAPRQRERVTRQMVGWAYFAMASSMDYHG